MQCNVMDCNGMECNVMEGNGMECNVCTHAYSYLRALGSTCPQFTGFSMAPRDPQPPHAIALATPTGPWTNKMICCPLAYWSNGRNTVYIV